MEVKILFRDTKKFVFELNPEVRQHALHLFKLLRSFGSAISPPHSKHIEAGIFELRNQHGVPLRFLYTFHQDKAYILHGFIKKRSKISQNDLEVARFRLRLLRDV